MTELLSDILESNSLGFAIKNTRVVMLWEKAVSKEIARQTEAIKIYRKVLYVEVKSSVWAQELRFLKGAIITKLNSMAGYDALHDIQFKAGG